MSAPNLSNVAGTAELYRALATEIQRRETVWVRLNGLAVDRADLHGALHLWLRKLEPQGGTMKDSAARRIVLDWSPVETASAEGLAFFLVLIRRLRELRREIIVCAPTCSDVREAVASLEQEEDISGVQWVFDRPVRSRRIRTLGPPAVFGPGLGRANVSAFLSRFRDQLKELCTTKTPGELAEAVAMELVQNIGAHAGPTWACTMTLLEERRRPPRIQIGMADNGAGIALHVLQQPRHQSLAPFTDRAVVEAVLREALSGRDEPQGGGGFSRLARELTHKHGGDVWVRSGTALIHLPPGGSAHPRGASLSAGYGTQVRVTLPLA